MKHTKNQRRLKLVLLGLIVIVVALLVMMCHYDRQFTDYGRKAEYLSNFGYARVFKVNRLKYESIYQKYGRPVKEETLAIPDSTDGHLVLMQYPSFTMCYVEYTYPNGTIERSLYLLIVQDDAIQFGRKKIHIGSTREEVHRAYAKEPAISAKELAYSAEGYPDVDEGFYGEDWSRILFCYDENGIVESMAYQPPAF